MIEQQLNIAFLSYWHAGTGSGSGYHLDALVYTDAEGLPRLPGRTIKGVIRDAFYRAEVWGWDGIEPNTTELLFGSHLTSLTDSEESDIHLSQPGMLRFSDAQLSAADRFHLQGAAATSLRERLFREHFSTAIDATTGVATEHSLRGMQVTIPLQLSASVMLQSTHVTADEQQQQRQQLLNRWPELMRRVLPLITNLGSHRHRGFGRAEVTLTDPQMEG